MADDEKKIIVDEDWKTQAQKEKDELSGKEKNAEEEKTEASEGRNLPAADMIGLVSMLATQAFYALGAFGAEGRCRSEDRP